MVTFGGMKQMTHRMTIALDQEAAERLKRLTEAWQVSQAEVVRRVLAMAESVEPESRNAASLLRSIHESGKGLERDAAIRYMSDLRETGKTWRGNW